MDLNAERISPWNDPDLDQTAWSVERTAGLNAWSVGEVLTMPASLTRNLITVSAGFLGS